MSTTTSPIIRRASILWPECSWTRVIARSRCKHNRRGYDVYGDGSVMESEGGGSGGTFTSTGVTRVGPGPATAMTLNPPAATNEVGTEHTVTATVSDASGQPAAPVTVRSTVTGSTHTTGTCTTGNGSCTFTCTGPQLPGADSTTACADTNSNSTCDPGEPIAEAAKAWLLPASSTAGKVTGGGQVPSTTDRNKQVSFGFEAQNQNGTLKGNCSVVDQTPAKNIVIKCLDATSLVRSGNACHVLRQRHRQRDTDHLSRRRQRPRGTRQR